MMGTFLSLTGGADVPPEVKLVRTSGYAEDGDAGWGYYAEAAAEPAHAAKFHDLYFRWFGLAEGQEVRPEQFGAERDGTSDDAAAIEAALAVAQSAIVRLEAGTYAIASPITVPPSKRLQGSGRGATTIRLLPGFGSGTAGIRSGAGASAIGIFDLAVDAAQAGGADAIAIAGSGFHVARVDVRNASGRGLLIEGGSAATPASGLAQDVRAENCGTLFETRHANGVTLDSFTGSNGSGDNAVATVVRVLAGSRNILLRNGRFRGEAASGVSVAGDAGDHGAIVLDTVAIVLESDGVPLSVAGPGAIQLFARRCGFAALAHAAGGSSPAAVLADATLFASDSSFAGVEYGLLAQSGTVYASGCDAVAGTAVEGTSAAAAVSAAAGAAIYWSGGSLAATGPAGLTAAFAGSCLVTQVTRLSPVPAGGNPLAVGQGGTGAINAAGARGNLGLGSLATQASDAVAITGGSVTGLASLACAGSATLGDAIADTHVFNGSFLSTNRSEFARGFRVTGSNTGGTGPACELFYSSGGLLISMDRTTAAYQAMTHRASSHVFQIATTTAATVSSTGLNLPTGAAYRINAIQVVAARRTGWGAPTGTAARTAFATYAAPAMASPPAQTDVQAMADHLQILSQRVKALVDDLAAHGLIGA
jgi:hypothetical protein